MKEIEGWCGGVRSGEDVVGGGGGRVGGVLGGGGKGALKSMSCAKGTLSFHRG